MSKKPLLSWGTKSLWMEEDSIEFKELEKDMKTDIAIVGAGISGLTTAYLLAKAGKKVAVFERGSIMSGQSALTTAHLSNAIDDKYYEMQRLHGEEGAKLIAESHTKAIEMIEAIIKEEKIECDFQRLPGYLVAQTKKEVEELQKEYLAAKKAGISGVKLVTEIPWQNNSVSKALLFPQQGQFHLLKYLNGLSKACLKRGVKLFQNTPIHTIEEGKTHKLFTGNQNKILTKHVLLATNSPVNRNIPIHTRQAPYRSYVIGVELPEKLTPPFLAWDMKEAYYYVRFIRTAKNILMVGGEDHRTGEAMDMKARYARLEKWTKKHFPYSGKTLYRWSGQVMETVDGLAFIGENPGSKNMSVITGDSGHGMTHGTLGAKIIHDLILNIPNPWAKLYSPSRFELKVIPKYFKEAFSTGLEYVSWFEGDKFDSEKELKKGEGAVFSKGLKKICVYKDLKGKLYKCSAVCPHLGGIVSWNPGEKSWDCPCHGSRFTVEGKVIEGPAINDLPSIES